MLVRLYVGADNTTKEVDMPTLLAILNDRFDGYTITESVGAWKGTQEKSVVVETEIADNVETVVDEVVRVIKANLDQQSVGVVILPAMSFM